MDTVTINNKHTALTTIDDDVEMTDISKTIVTSKWVDSVGGGGGLLSAVAEAAAVAATDARRKTRHREYTAASCVRSRYGHVIDACNARWSS